MAGLSTLLRPLVNTVLNKRSSRKGRKARAMLKWNWWQITQPNFTPDDIAALYEMAVKKGDRVVAAFCLSFMEENTDVTPGATTKITYKPLNVPR